MKYYIIAGEASGDLHASNLIKRIKEIDSKAEIRGFGGDRMEKAGTLIEEHYENMAFMGLWEVIINLKSILNLLNKCKKSILQWQPDVVITVDYPGFNMRIAEFAKKNNFKVFYYIPPQVWAWKKHRVHKINRISDLTFVALPFEKEFYAKYGYNVEYTGCPIIDSLQDKIITNKNEFLEKFNLTEKPIIALLPGSRWQEIKKILPKMIQIESHLPDYQLVISKVSSVSIDKYLKIIKNKDIKIVENCTSSLLVHSEAALVTSGTATLETALLKTPQIVCYKMSWVTAIAASLVVKSKFISLVNIIAGKKIVTELIQHNLSTKNILKELKPLLKDSKERKQMLSEYQILIEKVGEPGTASRAAALMVDYLRK